MATFEYTRILETVEKDNFDAWLTSLTAAADTRIIYYEEFQTVDSEEYIRAKIVLEVETP